MTDFDRQLADLLSTLTDEGQVVPLRYVVEDYGTERTERAIRDGFAVIRRAGDDLDDDSFLPIEEAVVVLHHVRKTDDYIILGRPWAAIGLEDEPNSIFRYAADEPNAIAEIRSRHAERRQRWEQRCR
jgi:hypothetical protein